MKKNKNLCLIIFLAFTGCMKDESVLWSHFKESTKSRSPAQTSAASKSACFLDRVNDVNLQSEINQWELAYAGGKRGAYTGRIESFSDLPEATIDVLLENTYIDKNLADSWIWLNSTQKDCKELSCIINALYSKPSDQGLLHYWYFLKTGYAMGAFQGYPWFESGKTSVAIAPNLGIEPYLFNVEEWKAWWLQASLLPKSMLRMGSLRSIHRTPHGYIPADWQTSGTCGWSLGVPNEGLILLSDGCLVLDDDHIFDHSNYFYISSTHELGHRLSAWNLGASKAGVPDMDSSPEFLALSNWRVDELVGKDGKITRQWNNDENAGWITAYAETDPAEDFAEAVGHYRNVPEQLLRSAPRKYAYVKEKIFGGHGYTSDELMVQYAKQVSDGLINHIDEWATSCLSESPDVPTLSQAQKIYADQLKLDLPISAVSKTCLSAQFGLKVTQLLSEIRYSEPEGCAILDVSEGAITKIAVPVAVAGILSYLKADVRLSDLIGGIKNFRTAVNQEYDAKALFLTCLAEASPQDCYQLKAASEFDRLYQKYKVQLSAGSDSLVPLEKSHFLTANDFDEVRGRVTEFYNGLFAGYSVKMEELAKTVWTQCSTPRVTPVTGQISNAPYSGGVFFIAPSILACLNDQTGIQMSTVRSLVAADKGIDLFSDESKNWINFQIIFPHFKSVFDTSLTAAEATELTRLNATKPKAIDDVFSGMTTDQAWRNTNPVYSYSDCKIAASKSFPDKLGVDQYRFTAVEVFEADLVDQVCEKVRLWIVSTASVPSTSNQASSINFLPTSSQKMTIDPAWASLKKLMVTHASERFSECSKARYIGSVGKRFCLFTVWIVDDSDHYRKNAWKWTSDRAIREWIDLPAANALMAQKGYSAATLSEIAESRLDDERQTIGDDILKAFNSK